MSKKFSKDEIWAAAKFLWENTPDITDLEMVDQLGITYGSDAPKSGGTISKRRRKESWTKKNPVKPVKNSLKTESGRAGIASKRNQESGNSKSIPSKDNKAQTMEFDAELESANSKIEEITQNVVIDAKGRALIIDKTRRRFSNLGKLFDQAVGAAMSIQGLVENTAFEDGKAGEEVQKALLLSESLSETAGNLAKTLKIIAEVEMPLCGITADDFKQSDQDRRLGALAALGDIDAEERKARERLKPELHERLKRIMEIEASDGFGHDDSDDDIDDIDYTSVD